MTNQTEKNAAQEAEAFLKEVCERHDWTLEELARHAGYELRTLQKATRPNAGVKLSHLMRRKIENASSLAATRSGSARIMEDPQIPFRSSNTPRSETLELLRSLLDDYERTTVSVKKRWLAAQIAAMATELCNSHNESVHQLSAL